MAARRKSGDDEDRSEPQRTREDFDGPLRAMGAMVFAVVAHRLQESGWPDRYVSHVRWRGWLEFKGPETPVAVKQRIVLRGLRARGDAAWVVRLPNRVEDEDGALLGEFDGTAAGLLQWLEEHGGMQR